METLLWLEQYLLSSGISHADLEMGVTLQRGDLDDLSNTILVQIVGHPEARCLKETYNKYCVWECVLKICTTMVAHKLLKLKAKN